MMRLSTKIKCGVIAGDDAFSANHPRILTPFTKAQLKKQKKASFELYMRMHSHLNELKSSALSAYECGDSDALSLLSK
jgi:hypothetical protein